MKTGYKINEVPGNQIAHQPGGLGPGLLTSIGYNKYSIKNKKECHNFKFSF